MVCVEGCQLQSRDLHQVKDKLNQIGYYSILKHHAIPSGMWLVSQEFVLMQDRNSASFK